VPYSKAEIFNLLKDSLHQLFEIETQAITLESRFYEDLDLDSIDAVDLIVHLQTFTHKKFKPDEFKAVRTIGDIVTVIERELSQQ
jgi:acyl carrier protein